LAGQIAYWGFNRIRTTKCDNFAAEYLIEDIAVPGPIGDVQLPCQMVPRETSAALRLRSNVVEVLNQGVTT